MKASEIIESIRVNDTLTVLYHKCAQDRWNPDNGKFSSLSGSVESLYNATSGVVQVKILTEKGIRSFTSDAMVKALKINNLDIVKNYELV